MVLTCTETVKKMHDHLDGDLSEEDHMLLKQHMEQCESCHDRYRQLHKTIAVIKYETDEKEDDISEFCQKIMNTLPKAKVIKRFYSFIKRNPYRSFASVCGLVLLGSWLLSIDTEQKLIVKIPDIDSVIVNGNHVKVPEKTLIHGDVFVANGVIDVAGTIEGDLIVMDGTYELYDSADIKGEIHEIDHSYERWLLQIENQVLCMELIV